MPKSLNDTLLFEVLTSKHDPMTLAAKHNMSFQRLVETFCTEANQKVIRGMCQIADLQTRAMLSRYRYIAASRLHALASSGDEKDKASLDLSRKACVDLLKIDASLTPAPAGDGVMTPEEIAAERASLAGPARVAPPAEPA